MQGGIMSQISPPVRILLVGCVLFLAAWMTVLKPKPAADPAPTAAAPTAPRVQAGGEKAGTALGKAVESANNASKAQAAANARHGDESQSAPATTAATAPATAAAKAKAATPAETAEAAQVTKAGLPLPVAQA